MRCLAHQKYVCYISIIYSQCKQDSEVQNRMIFRDREASFIYSVTDPIFGFVGQDQAFQLS